MSARIALAVAATLAAAPAWADDKVAPMAKASSDSAPSVSAPSVKVGGDSGASQSHATASASGGARPSGGNARPSGGGSRSGGGGHSSSGGPPRTGAQARHPRPGTGTGHFDDHHGHGGGGYGYGGDYGYGYGGGYGYRYPPYGYGYGYGWGWPYYGFGFYYPYNSWYSPYYYSGYYGYAPSYSHAEHDDHDSGSVRILVNPEKAKVYVDGYYAGIVDDFDGVFQRLNVPSGRHEITLKADGYRTQHFNVYVPVDDTIKIHFDMVRGTGEATSEEFVGRPADQRRAEGMDHGQYEPREPREEREGATVRLQVTPHDASVYVDGEFRGSGRESSSLRLSPGRHRLEVVRPGYRTVEREVEVEPGRGAELEIEMEKL